MTPVADKSFRKGMGYQGHQQSHWQGMWACRLQTKIAQGPMDGNAEGNAQWASDHEQTPSLLHASAIPLGAPRTEMQVSGSAKSQRSLGIHKILVRKIWFYPPPPKRAQNDEKLYKSVEDPQN